MIAVELLSTHLYRRGPNAERAMSKDKKQAENEIKPASSGEPHPVAPREPGRLPRHGHPPPERSPTSAAREDAGAASGGRPWPADLRHGRDHEPSADLGHGAALEADMFHAVKEIGGLDVQLVYFRGTGECRASKWVGNPELPSLVRRCCSVTGQNQACRQSARTRTTRQPEQ